jgi:lipopolysaccharide transport system permease protein
MSIYLDLGRQLLKNRRFVYEITRREIAVKNKGMVLGTAWLAIVPLIQSATYVLFVSVILSRNVGHTQFGYAVYVLSGLVPWVTMTRVLVESPTLLIERASLIKQVNYPLETIPFSVIMGALLAMGLTFIVLIGIAAFAGSLSWTVVLLPIVLLLLIACLFGAAWFLMVIGAVLKDIRDVVGLVMGLLIFLSPVMITEQLVGPKIWTLLLYNPFAHVVITFRDVMFGTFHPLSWAVLAGLAAFFILVGGWLLSRAKVMINEYI